MPIPPSLKRNWMPEKEAFEALAISRTTLYRRRRDGVLDFREFNHQVLVSRKSVERHLRID